MTTAPTDVPESLRPHRSWAAVAVLVAVFAAQAVESVRMFPTPRALLDDEHPVVMVDHAIHLYHGALGSRCLLEHGTPWGFDPFFMAGYPVTPVWDSSSNPSILFQALAGGGYHPRAYNIGLAACMMIALASVVVGARGADLGLPEAAVATVLGWLYYRCGWPDMLIRSGLFAFVTASCATIGLIGLLLAFDRRPSALRWVLLAGWGSLVLYTHVTAPFLAVGAAVGFLASSVRRHGWRWGMAVVAAGLAALAANLFWIIPLLRFRGIRSPEYFFMSPSSPWAMVEHYSRGDLESYMALSYLAAGLVGLAVWWVEGQRTRAASFGGAILVYLLLTTVGGQWSVTKTLEPLRFVVPLQMTLAVPAGSLLVRLSRRLAAALGGGRRGCALVASGWIVLGVASGFAFPSIFRVMINQLTVRPMAAGLQPEMRALVRCLRENTDPSARILFEDQLRLLEYFNEDSTHWTPLLPMLLGRDARQFIGGLYQLAFITHHKVASFGDFNLGGAAIDAWEYPALKTYCDAYNIGWVVCWSPLSRYYFDHCPIAQRVMTVPRLVRPGLPSSPPPYEEHALTRRTGRVIASRYLREGAKQYVLYRIDRPHSFFLQGTGQVARVDLNRIELTDVVPKDGAATLSLHWLDTWRSDPPLPLAPFDTGKDPVPFVKIMTAQPLKRVVLWNDYGRPNGKPPK